MTEETMMEPTPEAIAVVENWITVNGLSHSDAADRLGLSRDGLRRRLYGVCEVGQQTIRIIELERRVAEKDAEIAQLKRQFSSDGNEINRLRAEIAALQAQVEWRPISEAPRDEWVLCRGPHGLPTSCKWNGHFMADEWGHTPDPTHWRPLGPPDHTAPTDARVMCGCRQCLIDRKAGRQVGRMWIPEYAMRMVVCDCCGNKRCPHATDHRHACTQSNEPGQPDSVYGDHTIPIKGDAE